MRWNDWLSLVTLRFGRLFPTKLQTMRHLRRRNPGRRLPSQFETLEERSLLATLLLENWESWDFTGWANGDTPLSQAPPQNDKQVRRSIDGVSWRHDFVTGYQVPGTWSVQPGEQTVTVLPGSGDNEGDFVEVKLFAGVFAATQEIGPASAARVDAVAYGPEGQFLNFHVAGHFGEYGGQYPFGSYTASAAGEQTFLAHVGEQIPFRFNFSGAGWWYPYLTLTYGSFDWQASVSSLHLNVTSQPPDEVTAGDAFDVKFAVQDEENVEVTDYTGPVTIALDNNPGNATLGGRLTVNAVNGVADFSNLTIDRGGKGYTLKATATGFSKSEKTTTAFEVMDILAVRGQPPQTVKLNDRFSVRITAEDAHGNIDTDFNEPVTIELDSNPGDATLGGTLTVNAVNGVADFSDLTIDKADDGYTLQATSGDLDPVMTNSFDVTPPWINHESLTYVSSDLKFEYTVSEADIPESDNPTATLYWGDSDGNTLEAVNGADSMPIEKKIGPHSKSMTVDFSKAPENATQFILQIDDDDESVDVEEDELDLDLPNISIDDVYWHANTNPFASSSVGGIDFRYTVKMTGSTALPEPVTISIYWAELSEGEDSSTFDPTGKTPAYTLPSPITATGTFIETVFGSNLGTPPEGANALVVVADPKDDSKSRGAMAESDEEDNSASLDNSTVLAPVTTIDGNTVDPIRLDPSAQSTALKAVFMPAGGALSIRQAATFLGIDHFNFYQLITVPDNWTIYRVTVPTVSKVPFSESNQVIGYIPPNAFVASAAPDGSPSYVPPTGVTLSGPLGTTVVDPIVEPSASGIESFYICDTGQTYFDNDVGKTFELWTPIGSDVSPFDDLDSYYNEPYASGKDAFQFQPDRLIFFDRPGSPGGETFSFDTTLVGIDEQGGAIALDGQKINMQWQSNGSTITGPAFFSASADPHVVSGGITAIGFDHQPLNHIPSLLPFSDQEVFQGGLIAFDSNAMDVDADQWLRFTLDSAPPDATIDPITGRFSWRVGANQAPGKYTISVRVTDSGSPELSAVQSFTVTIDEAPSGLVLWTGAGGDYDWDNPANWSGHFVPSARNDAIIRIPGNVTIVHSSGDDSLGSLQSTTAISLTGGTLTVTGTMEVDNAFTLAGGTLAAATVLAGAGSAFVVSDGMLDGVTLDADATIADEGRLYIKDGLVLNATLYSTFSPIYFVGTQSVSGNGSIVLNGSTAIIGSNNPYESDATLTLAAGISVVVSQGGGITTFHSHGQIVNEGTITTDDEYTYLSLWADRIINHGSIAGSHGALLSIANLINFGSVAVSDDSSLELYGDVTSSGMVLVDHSTIAIDGAFVLADLNNFSIVGGEISIAGSLDLQGGTLMLDAASPRWTVAYGGAVKNGTIALGDGAQFEVFGGSLSNVNITTVEGARLSLQGGTLDGVTYSGNGTFESHSSVEIQNGLTLNGVLTVVDGELDFRGTKEISGIGKVLLNGSLLISSAIYGDGSFEAGQPATLTIGPGITLDAQAGSAVLAEIGDETLINNGVIEDSASSGALTITVPNVINRGVIRADNGGSLYVAGLSNFGMVLVSGGSTASLMNITVNSGTISATDAEIDVSGQWTGVGGNFLATNSTLTLRGALELSAVATITRDGGTLNLAGTLDLGGGVLALGASTGSWTLVPGGRITNGTISADAGAQLLVTGGTLDGVTLDTAPVITTGHLTIENGLILNSIFSLAGGTVVFRGTQTLDGTGKIVFGDGVFGQFAGFMFISDAYSPQATLTIAAGITIEAQQGGYLQANFGDEQLINYGVIEASSAYATLTIATAGTINQGTLQADDGGHLIIKGNWSNQGTIAETDSTVSLGGTFRSADAGAFNTTGGKVEIVGTMDLDGGTFSLNSATGNWTLSPAGRITSGSIATTEGAQLLIAGGTLDGVTLSADASLQPNVNLTVINGLVLNGTLTAAGGNIYFAGTQVLSGTGKLLIGGGPSWYGEGGRMYIQSEGVDDLTVALTVGPDVTIELSQQYGEIKAFYGNERLINAGTIAVDGGASSLIRAQEIVNQGALLVSGGSTLAITNLSNTGTSAINSWSAVTMDGAWQNSGTITIDTSSLDLGGAFTAADIGDLHLVNSTLNVVGTLDLHGGALALNAATGSWNLATYGTIANGTITTTEGAALIATGGTLDGVTLNGDMTARAYVDIINGLELNGVLTLAGTSATFLGTQTLTGTGRVLLGGDSSDSGGTIAVSAHGYGPARLTIGPGIIVEAQQSGAITANGNDSVENLGTIDDDVAGTTVTISNLDNQGTVEALNGGAVTLTGTWSNSGSLIASNSALNLGGMFTPADFGSLSATGGSITVVGALDLQGDTLALSATTGSWTLAAGGTIRNGTINATDGAQFLVTGGTLDGMTLDVDTIVAGGPTTVIGDLTLYKSLTVAGTLYFAGSQSLSGHGQLIFDIKSGLPGYISIQSTSYYDPATLTIGSGITVEGKQNGTINYYYGNEQLLNEGVIEVDKEGTTLNIAVGVINQGTLAALNGGTLALNGNAEITGSGVLRSSPGSTISSAGDLLGDAQSGVAHDARGTLALSGYHLQLVEVMSHDAGAVVAGFVNNDAYDSLSLTPYSYARLVDQSDNSSSGGAEALYVKNLVVPVGATLDLQGLNLYALHAQIDGTVTGGTVTMVAPAPTHLVFLYTPATGTTESPLGPVQVAVEDPFGNLVTSANSMITLTATGPGTFGPASTVSVPLQYGIATFTNLALNADGQYTLTATDPADSLATTPSDPIVLSHAATAAPQVQNVLLRGTNWSEEFLDNLGANEPGVDGYTIPVGSALQAKSLPWVNADQIEIVFTKDVNVQEESLVISGVAGTYIFSDFRYDHGSHLAIWTLSQPFLGKKYRRV